MKCLKKICIFIFSLFFLYCQGESENLYTIKTVFAYPPGQPELAQSKRVPTTFAGNVYEDKDITEEIEISFVIPQELLGSGQNIAFNAGRVSDVSSFYINHFDLGGMGKKEPYETAAMRPFFKIIPDSYIRLNRPNIIRIRLYRPAGGFSLSFLDEIKVGTSQAILKDYLFHELTSISFIILYLLATVYHLFLYIKRRKDRYHIYLVFFTILVSLYWFLAGTYTRDVFFAKNVMLQRKLEHITLYLMIPAFFIFLGAFFRDRIGRTELIILAVSLVCCLLCGFGTVNLMYYVLLAWQLVFLLSVPFFTYYVYKYVSTKTTEGLYLSIGLCSLVVTSINDVLVALEILHNPKAFGFSLSLFIFGLIGVLANYFIESLSNSEKLLSKVTRLNLELIKKNIHPHFLMNSIQTAVVLNEEDPEKANELLMELADELRSTIKASEANLSSLSSEIEICKNHLRVMSLRKEKKFQLKLEGNVENIFIPPLILLTLVENGLTHGYRRKEGGYFQLTVQQGVDGVRIELFNDSEDLPQKNKHKNTSTGFRYIEARLEEAFLDDWQLKRGRVNDGYRVILTFPFASAQIANVSSPMRGI